jgi:hypothetical protein
MTVQFAALYLGLWYTVFLRRRKSMLDHNWLLQVASHDRKGNFRGGQGFLPPRWLEACIVSQSNTDSEKVHFADTCDCPCVLDRLGSSV